MRKTFKIENLDCANCANQMEGAINSLPEIESANINFFTEKIKIKAEVIDDALMNKLQGIVTDIERHAKIVY